MAVFRTLEWYNSINIYKDDCAKLQLEHMQFASPHCSLHTIGGGIAMKRQLLLVFLASALLLAGCGEQNEKPQYEADGPSITAGI